MDFVWGMICILTGVGALWKAATSRDFYAATITRTEHPWRYPTWLGRIVAASIGVVAICVGILVLQSLKWNSQECFATLPPGRSLALQHQFLRGA